LSYDLKNEIENLSSSNSDQLNFPSLFFWVPTHVIELKNENFTFLQGEKNEASFNFISYFMEEETDRNFHQFKYDFKPRTSKEKYLETLLKIKDSIQRGYIYEVNYCQEFYCENVEINYPLDVYFKLNELTKAPFSSFLHVDEYSMFCGSPERYLEKKDGRLRSQPIKGTAPRSNDPETDKQLKEVLQHNEKERAENIMIVDLVRNDLSKIAQAKSVKVDELCQIYSFENVHQMISTISCIPKEDASFTDIIRATFPMGSMTGAPKLKAMEIIEQSEDFKRGLYSGSVGYISPNGDFDFNVVIRSLLFNEHTKYLSCSVGGAITIQSIPEDEYQECLTKVKRILDGLHA
jgi:para-aminobenzoate synthetase component 1